jgi:hypothetical protein
MSVRIISIERSDARAQWVVLWVGIIGAVAAFVGSSVAHTNLTIHILEKGVYQAETTSRTTAQDATSIRNTVRNPRLISDTAIVYGRLGVRFGLRYILSGTESPVADLKLVIRFPPVGLRDPATNARYFESVQVLTIQSDAAHYWEYHFENGWEIVPGVWHFEFWSDAMMLASQRFCVIDTMQPSGGTKAEGCQPLLLKAPADILRTR